ncbi:MAG TPA: hypothetical protein VK590_07890 [Saprospiraceae bacterium]|nr:hypothetical protein [Saprospiraceae bacterium]
MARLLNFLKFQGSIENLTFITTNNGTFVRRKTSLDKEELMTSPKFEASRKTMEEFKNFTQSTKLLKQGIKTAIDKIRDSGAHNRLMSIMNAIKETDDIHPRKWKTVATGILQEESKDLLRNFEFNAFAPLHTILLKEYILNAEEGIFQINALIPQKGFKTTKDATKAGLRLYWSKVDFESFENHTVSSEEVLVPFNKVSVDVNISVATPPAGTGTNVFTLELVFYQEVNGKLYLVNNREFKSLKIIGVV